MNAEKAYWLVRQVKLEQEASADTLDGALMVIERAAMSGQNAAMLFPSVATYAWLPAQLQALGFTTSYDDEAEPEGYVPVCVTW